MFKTMFSLPNYFINMQIFGEISVMYDMSNVKYMTYYISKLTMSEGLPIVTVHFLAVFSNVEKTVTEVWIQLSCLQHRNQTTLVEKNDNVNFRTKICQNTLALSLRSHLAQMKISKLPVR